MRHSIRFLACIAPILMAAACSGGGTAPSNNQGTTYALTATAGGGTGSGAVTATGINCTVTNGAISGDCTESYPSGTVVTLTATPAAGNTFAGWGGRCSGTGSCQVTMTQALTVSAGFDPPPVTTYALTVTAGNETGSGTVTASGISCTVSNGATSGDCSESYPSGTVVTLTATPAAVNNFAGWGGACSGTGSCQVTMTQARTVSAGFKSAIAPPPPGTYPLTVTAGGGTGTGTVTATGISCTVTNGATSGDCGESYAPGTVVTLTATPAAGNTFAGWGGACSGTGGCQVTMTAQRFVSAGFDPSPVTTYALTVTAGSGTGRGTVTATGISCTVTNGATSGDCSESYPSGTVVTLTATPAAGNIFAGWGGGCSGTGSCQVTMSQARTVSAGFNPAEISQTYYASYDNLLQYDNYGLNLANTVYQTSELGVGCDFYWELSGGYGQQCAASLMKFNVQSVIAGKTILEAKLRLYVYMIPGDWTGVSYKFAAVLSSWNPTTVTWNNVMANPNFYYYADTEKNWVPSLTSTLPIEFDVTGVVQAWASGTKANNGFMIWDVDAVYRGTTSLQIEAIQSLEVWTASGQRPQLFIRYQ